jgi:hypothetical protein
MFAALVFAAALQTGPAFVQLPSGGFVPCDHPLAIAAGLGCGQATPTAPSPAPVPPAPAGAPDCDPRPNPYLEPDRAAACSAWDAEHQPTRPLPTFAVRGVYRDATHQTGSRMVVLAVTTSLEGIPVVTAQRTAPVAGAVFSFRTDEAEAMRWGRVQ